VCSVTSLSVLGKWKACSSGIVHRTLSKQRLWGQVSVKLTPEICINNTSSYSRLTAAGRQATAADSHSQNCLQTLFSLSLPLMRKQPSYTCMLKNLLKLFCIWTWDTLWVFFVCVCAVLFYLCIPLRDNYRTTSEATSTGLEVETDTKIINTETSLHVNLERFFFIFFYFIYMYIHFFHLLIFHFYSDLYSFYFFFSILSLSL
jgi:hypothetical protein